MKKLFYLPLVLGAMAVAFTSCSDDDNGLNTVQINAIVQDGAALASIVSEVQAEIWGEDAPHTIASTAFNSNGTFSLRLSETPPASTLTELPSWWTEYFTVSDTAAKSIEAEIIGFDSDGEFVGWFWNEGGQELPGGGFSAAWEWYVYLDRNVSVTGTDTYMEGSDTITEIMNLHLRTGWNTVWWVISSTTGTHFTETTTTTRPAGSMTWVFESNDESPDDTSPSHVAPMRGSIQESVQKRVREMRRDARSAETTPTQERRRAQNRGER